MLNRVICLAALILSNAQIARGTEASTRGMNLSVDNRVGRKVFVAAEIASAVPEVAYGGRIGYFLTPDTILGFSHVISAVHHGGGEGAENDSFSVSQLTYKAFFTNVLYSDIGLARRRLSHGDDPKEHLQHSLVIHTGSQWQWRTATVGSDWIGYRLPLAGTGKIANERWELLRIYAGMSF